MAVIKTIGNVKISTPTRCTFKVEGVNTNQCSVTALGTTINLTGNTNSAVRYVHYRYECGTIVTSSKYTKLAAKKYPDINLSSGDFSFLYAVGARTLTIKLMAAVTTSTAAPTSGWTEIGSGTAQIPAKSQYTLKFMYSEGADAPYYELSHYRRTVLYNHNITITQDPGSAVSIFKGWARTQYAESATYEVGDIARFTMDTTLYSVMEPKEFTWRFFPNADGDYVKDMPEEQKRKYHTEMLLSRLTPKRPGYVFHHWDTEPDDSGYTYCKFHPGTFFYKGELDRHDYDLYAIWEPCIKVYSDGEWKDGLAYAWVEDEWLQADEQQVYADEEWKT